MLAASVLGAEAAASRPVGVPGPLRLAVVGLTHGHVYRFVDAALTRADIELVGLVEPRSDAVELARKKLELGSIPLYASLDELWTGASPVQAVAVFTSTYEHRAVVESCATRGVHVMMEKPLAVNMEHARAISGAALRGGIHVVVNYETSWSPAYREMHRYVREQGMVGEIRKMIARDGHNGPVAIGTPAPFRDWLTDQTLNGGGALNDMGCYGAGLMTWMMGGQRPRSVLAVLQNFKPGDYREVEDEATVVLSYPTAQGIIQASWNWPHSRKDLEVHGTGGTLQAPKRDELFVRLSGERQERRMAAPSPEEPYTSAIDYLVAVAAGRVVPDGPASLTTNLIVTEILDAARESARTGRRIELPPDN